MAAGIRPNAERPMARPFLSQLNVAMVCACVCAVRMKVVLCMQRGGRGPKGGSSIKRGDDACVCLQTLFQGSAEGGWSFCLAVFQKVPNARKLFLVRTTACVGGAGVMARTRAVAAGGTGWAMIVDWGWEQRSGTRRKKWCHCTLIIGRYQVLYDPHAPLAGSEPNESSLLGISWQEAN
jgi:hypothetical protein